MRTWRKWSRAEMLAWFATLDDGRLETVWATARSSFYPESKDENFICNGCRHNVPGLACVINDDSIKTYHDCEALVTSDPSTWEKREKHPIIMEGYKACRLYMDEVPKRFRKDNDGKGQCPYPKGSPEAAKWETGWDEAVWFAESPDKF